MKAFLTCAKMPAMKKQPTESDLEIGERIKTLRAYLDIKGTKLAADIGVSRGAVGNWERGQGIKRENLQKIADYYKVSFDWLATNRGEMWPQKEEDPSDSWRGKLAAVKKVFGPDRAEVLKKQVDAMFDVELDNAPPTRR